MTEEEKSVLCKHPKFALVDKTVNIIGEGVDKVPISENSAAKMFTVGMLTSRMEGEDKARGLVKEAKRKIEEAQRKNKRQSNIEKARNPSISTPNQKRSRDEDGAWSGATSSRGLERTPATPRRTQQTPIQGFLVSQSLAERKERFDAHLFEKERSSSSPTNAKTGSKRGISGQKKTKLVPKMKPGIVTSILRYFENSDMVPESSKTLPKLYNLDNNNLSCPPLPGSTELNSVCESHQGAAQTPPSAASPIRTPGYADSDHMTGTQPTKTDRLAGPEHVGPSGHL